MKTCTKCNQGKELSEFYAHKTSKDGYAWECKTCRCESIKSHREKNPDKVKESRRKYYLSHSGEINEKGKEYYRNNKEKVSETCKRYRVNNLEKCRESGQRYRDRNRGTCRESNRRWASDNRNQVRETNRNYAKNNPEKIKERHSEQARKHPEKASARTALNNAVRYGRIIKPHYCTQCFKTGERIHGHHSDYSKPLDVEWLCAECHGLRHRIEEEVMA